MTKPSLVETERARRAANTDDLFAKIAKKHADAAAEAPGILRDVAVRSAKDSEWHTLFAILENDPMRDQYDCERVAIRIEELLAASRQRAGVAS